MITEGDATIPLETTRRSFGNQEKSKQRSTIVTDSMSHQLFMKKARRKNYLCVRNFSQYPIAVTVLQPFSRLISQARLVPDIQIWPLY